MCQFVLLPLLTSTYRSYLDLSVDSNRSVLGRMQTEHSCLRQVDDWSTHHGAENATIADGEGASSHIFNREFPITGLGGRSILD